jgi:hypothetical protein
LGYLRVHLQGDEERAARVAGVPERDHSEAGAPGRARRADMRVRFPGSIGSRLRGEDQPARVLSQLTGRRDWHVEEAARDLARHEDPP